MLEARVISVNVGQPREVKFRGSSILTGIFKQPVASRVKVHELNLAGDRQADLTVHGGRDKAIYCYPVEHYPYWTGELPGVDLPYGMFGENLTTEGLDETAVYIGDQYRVGSAVLQVTQPRTPCYKLGIKLGRADMVEKFGRATVPASISRSSRKENWARAIGSNVSPLARAKSA
jgi:MOSC domain-containing protein YiiM